MVALWGVRLGYFLVSRVLSVGEDSRFRKVKNNFAVFLLYWTIQVQRCPLQTSRAHVARTHTREREREGGGRERVYVCVCVSVCVCVCVCVSRDAQG
jgi:steroid 5-alpha reductase family enzyme